MKKCWDSQDTNFDRFKRFAADAYKVLIEEDYEKADYDGARATGDSNYML